MKILITGVAGFIGFHLAKRLINEKYSIVGIDNLNDYYDKKLKLNRLKELGIVKNLSFEVSKINPNFSFQKLDINEEEKLNVLFKKNNFEIVIHLAAQAGVRYSLINPKSYIQTNVNGFYNVIQNCRINNIKSFIYASSSSVYGLNENLPYDEFSNTDNPISLYAATKKSNELIAHSYSHIYGLKTIGLRFFTVYGPWGRPDMAYYKFSNLILNNKPINIYNNGLNFRDFTYIDDIINGLEKIIKKIPKENFNIFNLGNNKSVSLIDFITILEKNLNKNAVKRFIEAQKGDVNRTWANIDKAKEIFLFEPNTSIEFGLKKFCKWFLSYEKIYKKN